MARRDERAGLGACGVEGLHHDCLDAAGGWAVTLPEPGGLSLDTAIAAITILARAGPVLGYGATTISLPNGDAPRTVDAAAALACAAFGG